MSRKTTRAGHVRTTAILAGLLLPLLVPAVPVRAGDLASAAPADPPVLAPAAEAASGKPSIVLILTDDQDASLTSVMPNLKALARQGATFTHAYYNDPLCAPSRATILTGLYDHDTGVTANDHRLFYDAGLPGRTIAVWLHAAGYRIGFVGKYLNEYPAPAPATYVPPGWDYWVAHLGETTGETWRSSTEFDYDLNNNGTVVHRGGAPADYATDVYRAKAVGFVREAVADRVPFFLELATHAPHFPATPAPRDAALFPALEAPRVPSFNEADVSDKPAYVRALPRFDPADVDAKYRERARSLQAVDDALKAITDALAADGRLANTYVVFTSDNGFELGPHRIGGQKSTPYEETVRMPLYVRGPGVRAGLVLPQMVGNVDLAPTFAAWAGAAAPAGLDGRSLAPLLRPGAPGPGALRQAYPLNQLSRVGIPSWRGVRTRRYTYVEYATDEKELYDNTSDPYQLRNIAATADPALLGKLARRTAALAACKGGGCRTLEDAPL
jgi:N-acetylglucosamine-6-sulfatase